ncbi:Stk1 family PASTA domain-containing Ser/Thr kinase [Pseudarthrobacter enclensis]|uniref:Stk1 family PASTA domain-containing Ser/Thr kinase n=1 Tax=Pseudarthrobacter enclensis TaxID=993070 RepID=UPI00368404B1
MNESSRAPLHREDNVPVDNQRVLGNRYELGNLIGRGGMADVYRGTDTRLGRTVAIKILRPDMARDPQFQARFKREAQSVAALNHSSIVAIYDTGEQQVHDGSEDAVRLPYIVMEFVDGRTLRDLIRAKEVSISQAIDYCLGVLAALEYSHRAGIVHRDIKPANVMYCEGTNTVKVMDFGIARAMADSSATMTQTQAVVGTAQYLSPEQARGETVDARSDLYSAACLLYEMLTSRPPFIGDSPVSVAYQHVREIPAPASSINPEVSQALDTVLAKALQKNRDDRFQDAAAFQRALRAARSGIAVPAVPASEAPTDPNDHVPAPEAPPTEAFAAGAAFTDDAPTGRLAATGAAFTDGDGTRRPLEVPEAQSEAESLPLGLTPERERPTRQKSRRRAWIATLAIFTLLVLAGGGLWLYDVVNRPAPAAPKVDIPVVASMTESAALQELYNAELKPKITRSQNDSVPKGIAIGTDPTSGQKLDPGSEVVLNISEGPSAVKIPENLPGTTEAAARDILRQVGLVGAPSTTTANSATVPAGIVITTSPAPGQSVGVGTTVELVVSTGKVAVPELRGSTRAEAEAALKDLGLVPNVIEAENGQVEPGRVTDQSDAVNAAVEQGKTITIVVAKAPPPSATPTPTPTSTRGGRDRDE